MRMVTWLHGLDSELRVNTTQVDKTSKTIKSRIFNQIFKMNMYNLPVT